MEGLFQTGFCHMTFMWDPLYPVWWFSVLWRVSDVERLTPTWVKITCDSAGPPYFIFFDNYIVINPMSIHQGEGKSRPCDQAAASAILLLFSALNLSPEKYCHCLSSSQKPLPIEEMMHNSWVTQITVLSGNHDTYIATVPASMMLKHTIQIMWLPPNPKNNIMPRDEHTITMHTNMIMIRFIYMIK